jgi:hypothetical protein
MGHGSWADHDHALCILFMLCLAISQSRVTSCHPVSTRVSIWNLNHGRRYVTHRRPQSKSIPVRVPCREPRAPRTAPEPCESGVPYTYPFHELCRTVGQCPSVQYAVPPSGPARSPRGNGICAGVRNSRVSAPRGRGWSSACRRRTCVRVRCGVCRPSVLCGTSSSTITIALSPCAVHACCESDLAHPPTLLVSNLIGPIKFTTQNCHFGHPLAAARSPSPSPRPRLARFGPGKTKLSLRAGRGRKTGWPEGVGVHRTVI